MGTKYYQQKKKKAALRRRMVLYATHVAYSAQCSAVEECFEILEMAWQ